MDFICNITNIKVNNGNLGVWQKSIKSKNITNTTIYNKIINRYNDGQHETINKDNYTNFFTELIESKNNEMIKYYNDLYNYNKIQEDLQKEREAIETAEDDEEDEEEEEKSFEESLDLSYNLLSSAKMKSKSMKSKSNKSPSIPLKKSDIKYHSLSANFKYNIYKNLDDRYKNFKELFLFFKKIKKNNCLNYISPNKFSIEDKITLYKRIGSESSYGINYLSRINNESYNLFASKIQFNNKVSNLEIFLLTKITQYALIYKNPHLPLLYKSIICRNMEKNDRYPNFFKTNSIRSYNILFNELAAGDLKSFLSSNNDERLWKNAIEQMYMAIATLHSIGIIHNDTNNGNFLYYKIQPGGCFRYIINGKNYYIENMGYLWVIWDFGVSNRIYRIFDYMYDYNMTNLFFRHNNQLRITDNFKKKYELDVVELNKRGIKKIIGNTHRKWGYIPSNISISPMITELIDNLWKYSFEDRPNDYYADIIDNNLNEAKWLEFLLDNNILFSKTKIGYVNKKIEINFENTKPQQILLDKSLFFINDIPKKYLD